MYSQFPHYYFPVISALLLVLLTLNLLVTCTNGQGQQQQQREPERRYRRYFGANTRGDGGRRPVRIKRMFAVCPPQYERIGNGCYYVSQEKVNWLDAQFKCLDRDGRLAEPNKADDRRLRKHFLAATAKSKLTFSCPI